MPDRYSSQYREMVLAQIRAGTSVPEVAASLEVSEATVYRWRHQDRVDRGETPGTSSIEHAALAAAHRRIAELEAELAATRRASALFDRGRVVPLPDR